MSIIPVEWQTGGLRKVACITAGGFKAQLLLINKCLMGVTGSCCSFFIFIFYCFLLIKWLLFMCGPGNKALLLYKLTVSRRIESSETKMKVKHGK